MKLIGRSVPVGGRLCRQGGFKSDLRVGLQGMHDCQNGNPLVVQFDRIQIDAITGVRHRDREASGIPHRFAGGITGNPGWRLRQHNTVLPQCSMKPERQRLNCERPRLPHGPRESDTSGQRSRGIGTGKVHER